MRELPTYQVHVELRGATGSVTHETLPVHAFSASRDDLLLDTLRHLRAAAWCTARSFRIVGAEGVAGLGTSPWQLIIR